MTTTDPRWTDSDRAWAVALEEYEDGLCSSCGLPRRICMDPENEGRFRGELPVRCHATTAQVKFQESYDADPALQFPPPTLVV